MKRMGGGRQPAAQSILPPRTLTLTPQLVILVMEAGGGGEVREQSACLGTHGEPREHIGTQHSLLIIQNRQESQSENTKEQIISIDN